MSLTAGLSAAIQGGTLIVSAAQGSKMGRRWLTCEYVSCRVREIELS